MTQRIAIASNDGQNIDVHFARASRYYIYDVGNDGYALVETRTVAGGTRGGHHEFEPVMVLLKDCAAVFASRIGPGAARILTEKGLRIFEAPYPIPAVLDKVVAAHILDSH